MSRGILPRAAWAVRAFLRPAALADARPVCSSADVRTTTSADTGVQLPPRGPFAIGGESWDPQCTIDPIALDFVEYALALPASTRLRALLPRSLRLDAKRNSLDYVCLTLAHSVLEPGQWRRGHLCDLQLSASFLATRLAEIRPALLWQLVHCALVHMPSLYSLSELEVESLAWVLSLHDHRGTEDSLHHFLFLQEALGLRRVDIIRAVGCMTSAPLLMELFTVYAHGLFGSWLRAPAEDKQVAWAVLDRLATVLLQAATVPVQSFGSAKFSSTTQSFCRELLFCHIDHPRLLTGLEYFFSRCLAHDKVLTLSNLALMAITLSSLRGSPAPGFVEKLGAAFDRCATAEAKAGRPWQPEIWLYGNMMPYMVAWAFMAQGVAMPTSCRRIMAELPPPQDARRQLRAGVDFVATAMEQVLLDPNLPAVVAKHVVQRAHIWANWSDRQQKSLAGCGFDLDVNIGGLRAALAVLAVANVDGSVGFKDWPRSAPPPSQVSWANVHRLPGVPVAVVPFHRVLCPSGRLQGPHYRKLWLLSQRGWAVVTVADDRLRINGDDELDDSNVITLLRRLIFNALHERDHFRPRHSPQWRALQCTALPVMS